MAAKSNVVRKKSKQKSRKTERVRKPYKSFPLTSHRRTNRWCQKRKHRETGKDRFYYCGPLDDWQAALAKYEHDWRYIVQGIDPPEIEDDPSTLQGMNPSDTATNNGSFDDVDLSDDEMKRMDTPRFTTRMATESSMPRKPPFAQWQT